MKWNEGMPKPPRGFWVINNEIERIPEGEEGFDPNAANVNLEEYYAALADTAARYMDPKDWIPPQ